MSIRDELPSTRIGYYWTVSLSWTEGEYRVTLYRLLKWHGKLTGDRGYVFAVTGSRDDVVDKAHDAAEALGYLA